MKTITHEDIDSTLPMALADLIELHHVTQEEAAAALISLLAFTMEDADVKEMEIIYGPDGCHKLCALVVEAATGKPDGVRLQ